MARCELPTTHLMTKYKMAFADGEEMDQESKTKIRKLNGLVDAVCGIYSRVARKLGVHRTFVSRVARGERQSEPVEKELVTEFDRVQNK